jgi:hypothetical protein
LKEAQALRTATARVATERLRADVTVGVVRVRRRRVPSPVLFCALEGSVRVVIAADSDDDARCLCREMGLEFIGLCD